jgi:glycosyl transferase family 25
MRKWVFGILCLSILLCIVLILYTQKSKNTIGNAPTLVSAHVINLEESKDRWNQISGDAQTAGLPIQRWPATEGRRIEESDIRGLGLSKLIVRQAKKDKRMGVIGAFVSHRALLRHLNTLSANPTDAHLILEDDAHIPADFWNHWSIVAQELPDDWDIVQLGVTYPHLVQRPGCSRLHNPTQSYGNVGAFAYVVRHGALSKIVTHLQYMYDPIDNMIRNKQGEWNIYYVWPEICAHNGNDTTLDQ